MSECPFANFSNLIDPDTYANGMPYDELKRIRDSGPIHWMDDPREGQVPYWLVTGRDEIDFGWQGEGAADGEDRLYLVDMHCRTCGHDATVDLRKGGDVKLPWRVDWPMRWASQPTRSTPSGISITIPCSQRLLPPSSS